MNKPLHPDQLRSLTPLNALSSRQLQELRTQLIPQPLLAGELLFGPDSAPTSSYFLLAGALALQHHDGEEQRLHAGTMESLHAFSAGSRVKRIRALDDCSLLIIDSGELDRLLAWRQSYQDLLLELAMAGELTDWLEEALENPLFAKVPPENIRRMLGELESVELPAGYELLREGEGGDCCYFLKSGRAEVISGVGGDRQVVAELEVGACFGEEALLSERPRNASVTLLEDGSVLRLSRQAFLALLKAPVVAEIDYAAATELIDAGAQWLDVRLLEEYQHGHATMALNMPLHLLRLKARLLDGNRTYLCYCDSGKRSTNAVFLLAQLGFTVHALKGGLDALTAGQRQALLSEQGSGYVARSGGRIERSD
ncbi:cyclic nucleotide-binding domain-containing protein [Stutzerimonas nitrititolerans]|uniref:cyclic nucleotide-binding domain-containing protein n=1 Tax=Stutzerimonas nitrititolerans TaxID=2482751 RepID=UPI0028A20EDB|nr:cyclic nucleotide-binding domain-containing protein [Stutzerimonas nitrititolerans]